ncbi:MAG: general secretion pathway protein GspK [Verrucomicrobia bacterium]|nr:general secretion pathway protein GspK [Verrucomicrobiota bacterium]
MSHPQHAANPARHTHCHHQGSIIIAVLGFIVLLTFIVVAFMEEATDRIRYYGLFFHRDDLRTEAYSALEASLAVINEFREIDRALWGPAQGWADPLTYAGFVPAPGNSVRVNIRDESGKIPLENIDLTLLRYVFEELGFERFEQEVLADHLLDWIDEDDLPRISGMDGDAYRRLDPPYNPANRMLKSWQELQLIPPFREYFWDEQGMARPIFRDLQSMLTWHHTGPVNINGANTRVLNVLQRAGILDATYLQQHIAGADGIPGTEDDRLVRGDIGQFLLTSEQRGLVGTEITLLRIEIEVQRGVGNFLLTALVTWTGANVGGRGNQNQPAASRSGPARTATPSGTQLGYPFEIRALTENNRL